MIPPRASGLPLPARAQAGALGTTMVTLAARTHRPLLPPGLYARFQPPSLDRVAKLLSPRGPVAADPEINMARVSAVAQLSGRFDRHARALLKGAEREVLKQDATKLRDDHVKTCRHCAICQRLQYGEHLPRAVTINHGARIDSDFDPDSNVSRAAIANHQMFVRGEALARTVITMAHPLRWVEAASPMFERSDPAIYRPGRAGGWNAPRLDTADRERAIGDWREAGEGFVYENVGWAWNEYFGSKAENIIRIKNLIDREDGHRLEFDYTLEKCLITNFGIAWERGGLDIDTGTYQGRVKAVSELTEDDIPGNAAPGYPDEKVAADTLEAERRLSAPELKAQRLQALRRRGDELSHAWGEPAFLVTISASKQLRYTRLQNSPDELRAFLNWTSPALLFVFINRSVCQYVHLLPDPTGPADTAGRDRS